MFADIVFPDNNEKELAVMAQRLGISRLLLLYPFGKVPALPDLGVEILVGVVASPNDFEKARQRHQVVAVRSSEYDRVLFERTLAPTLLLNLGEGTKEDRMHQRDAGLNQPLMRDIARREAKVVLSVASLLRAEGQERATLMGRWMQNIALCRKMKVKVVIASCASMPYEMRSCHDMQSLGIILGMHPQEAQEAVSAR
jgi:hypothetical protein